MPEEKCIIDPSRDCLGLQKAEMLEKQLNEYRERSRETHKEFFERIRELEKADAARDEQYEAIIEKLDKLVSWHDSEQTKPGKRWDDIIDKAIWAVLAAVIAFVLARIGL